MCHAEEVGRRPPLARVRQPDTSVGPLLRAWRDKRKLSQLALALDAGISARHLSFVETGRSRPSPELVVSLAQQLAVPLRGRNELLLAAGYAPRFPETSLGSSDMNSVKNALQRLLDAHDPYPGVALDRYWNVVLANTAAKSMVAMLPPSVTQPTLNMFRAGLHPEGFAAVTENFDEWGRYLLGELERIEASMVDATATALLDELRAYPNVRASLCATGPASNRSLDPASRLLVPCTLCLPNGRLSLFTTLATFGSPRDVTLAELTVELFYPADPQSAAALEARR